MLSHTSTEWAPWHVIPADHKWFARIAASAILADALIDDRSAVPHVNDDTKAALQQAKAVLEGEAP